MQASIENIKELRNRTGAGVNAVKDALENSNSLEEAVQFLRQKGEAKGAKRADKETKNGVVGIYKHQDGRLVVLVEVVAETDFASRSQDLIDFASNIALHIAAMDTQYLDESDVPAEIIQQEKAVAQSDVEGKPVEIADKIIQGKLDKFYKANVLLDQSLFSDDSKTVGDYLNELVAKVGEKIEINRFVKLQIGKDIIVKNRS